MNNFAKEYHVEKYANIYPIIDVNDVFRSYMKAVGVPYIFIYNKKKQLVSAYRGTTNIDLIHKKTM